MKNSTASNSTQGMAPVIGVDIQVGLTCLGVVAFIVSLVGNSIVIHVVRTRRHMRGTTNFLISNMSAADILITFMFPYLVKFYYVGEQWFGGIMGTITCKVIHSTQMISIFCSVYTLLVISVDRFLGVMKPMHKIFTSRVTKWSIVIVWIASILFSVPLIIAVKVTESHGIYECKESWDDTGMSPRDHILSFFCLTYVLPLVFISIAYGISGYKLWGSTPPGQQNSITRRNNRPIIESRRNATKMLITVVVLFALCWLPFQVREIIRVEAPDMNPFPFKLELVLPWFGFSNSCINPIIYVIFSATFRREFKEVLLFWRTYSKLDSFNNLGSPSLASKYTTQRHNVVITNGKKKKNLTNDTCV